MNLALENGVDSLYAIIDVHEAASLMAIAPDFNFTTSGHFGFNNLAADRSRRFFSAAGPSAVWSVNIVKACNAAFQAEILFKMAAHPFTEKFFPAVAVFRQCRISILFFQRNDIGSRLFLAVVDTSGRRVKETLHALVLGGQQHVCIDEHTKHTERPVVLNEAHAAHISRELKNGVDVLGSSVAIVLIS